MLDIEGLTAPVSATAAEGLTTSPDVFVEFTKPEVAKSHVLSALRSGAHVVVGTSGLSEGDYEEIDEIAHEILRYDVR